MKPGIVSVIVPVYNPGRRLIKCIESVLNQTYGDLDVILVNDGSDDGSGDICDYYASQDRRIQVIHTENNGVSIARNLGISKARGEYIQFVDSDDYVEPQMTELLVRAMVSHRTDVVMCGLRRINNNETITSAFNTTGCFSINDFVKENIEIISDNVIGSPCNKVFKRGIINKHTVRYPVDVHYAEDLLFNYEYLKHSNSVVLLPDALYNYCRFNSDSLSSKFREDCYDHLYMVYKSTMGFVRRYDLDETERRLLANKFANLYVSLVGHLYREDSTLSLAEKREILDAVFSDREVLRIIDGAHMDRFSFRVIWFFVEKRCFGLLQLFFLLKNVAKRSTWIEYAYRNWRRYSK